MPPTSVMWPNIAAQATSRPSRKIGISSSQSLRWLIAPAHGIRIVGEEDVAILDRPVVAVMKPSDEGAELADDHLAFLIGDHREGVVLLADARRHRGAEQHRVHLDAGVAQRVLDDVERDRIDGPALEGRWLGLDGMAGMSRSLGRTARFRPD